MKEEKENTTSKIDQYMSDIDVEKDFLNTDTGQKYEIGKWGPKCVGGPPMVVKWNHFMTMKGIIWSPSGEISDATYISQ